MDNFNKNNYEKIFIPKLIDPNPIGLETIAKYTIELAFTRRDSLIYAARLIGERRLLTETKHGIETAEDVLKQEFDAKKKYGNSSLDQLRNKHFNNPG